MNYCDYYRIMAAEISDKDVQNALRVLAGHVGKDNPITRQQLAQAVYGKFTSSTDRKVRDIIPMLLENYKVAVAATSGKAGYYICENYAEKMEAYQYLNSVKNEVGKRAMWLYTANLPEMAAAIPAQTTLFSGGF